MRDTARAIYLSLSTPTRVGPRARERRACVFVSLSLSVLVLEPGRTGVSLSLSACTQRANFFSSTSRSDERLCSLSIQGTCVVCVRASLSTCALTLFSSVRYRVRAGRGCLFTACTGRKSPRRDSRQPRPGTRGPSPGFPTSRPITLTKAGSVTFWGNFVFSLVKHLLVRVRTRLKGRKVQACVTTAARPAVRRVHDLLFACRNNESSKFIAFAGGRCGRPRHHNRRSDDPENRRAPRPPENSLPGAGAGAHS